MQLQIRRDKTQTKARMRTTWRTSCICAPAAQCSRVGMDLASVGSQWATTYMHICVYTSTTTLSSPAPPPNMRADQLPPPPPAQQASTCTAPRSACMGTCYAYCMPATRATPPGGVSQHHGCHRPRCNSSRQGMRGPVHTPRASARSWPHRCKRSHSPPSPPQEALHARPPHAPEPIEPTDRPFQPSHMYENHHLFSQM